GTPPFYISLWDTARRPPRTVKSPQLSLRRVGAKCTLSFFGFPKGNPMVHGELASRRPGCILGGVAPQQRESLAVLLARLRSDSPCTIGPPFYISLWDTARRPPRTVKSPLLSLRRVGARCTLFFPPEGESWGRVYSFFFFPEGESWGQVYTFLFPKERVGAKCTLGFFPKVFPKGTPMVHGEVGSRRPDVHTWRHRPHGGSTPVGANACGSLAVLQQAALRFALHHRIPLRISLLLIFRFALHHRTPLLYKPLGLRAEPPAHRQVAPPLPEESWGQVYTFHFPRFRVGKPPGLGSLLSVVRPPLHSTGYRNP